MINDTVSFYLEGQRGRRRGAAAEGGGGNGSAEAQARAAKEGSELEATSSIYM
jgi:hypothetical protein